MLLILGGMLIWYPALLGWGTPLALLIRESNAEDGWLYAALAGMALLATLVNFLNFWLPIRPLLALTLLGLGWVAFLVGLWHWRLWAKPSSATVILGLLLAVGISLAADQSPYNYETGLYHLQTVKWLTSSKTPFGLANLLGQFGFNSAWFSFAASLETPWLQGKSVFLANSLMVWVFGLAVVQAARQFSSPKQVSLANTLLVLSMLPWVSALMSPNLNSLSADLPITLITLLMSYWFIKAWAASATDWRSIAALVFIALFALTLKLSAILLGLYPLVLLGRLAYEQRSRLLSIVKPITLFSLASALALLGPWLARNVVLSGCVIYPVIATCLPGLAWRVPLDQVKRDGDFIVSWAHGHGIPDLSKIDWFAWMRALPPQALGLGLLVGGLGVGMYWLGSRKNSAASPYSLSHLWPVVIPLAGLGFWLVTAPDLRFAEGYFWAIGLYVFSLALYRFYKAYELQGMERLMGMAGGLIGLIVILAWPVFVQPGWQGTKAFWVTNPAELVAPRQALIWQWPALPEVQVVYHVLTPGEGYVYVPVVLFPCWDAPLPCSPGYPDTIKIVMPHGDLSEVVFAAKP